MNKCLNLRRRTIRKSHHNILDPSHTYFLGSCPVEAKGFSVLGLQEKCELSYIASLTKTPNISETNRGHVVLHFYGLGGHILCH